MGIEKYGERKGQPLIGSIPHGGGSVMVWVCIAAHITGLLVFIDDVTAGRSSRMNSEVYWAVRSAHI